MNKLEFGYEEGESLIGVKAYIKKLEEQNMSQRNVIERQQKIIDMLIDDIYKENYQLGLERNRLTAEGKALNEEGPIHRALLDKLTPPGS